MTRRRAHGFTLIELMIALAVGAIVASVAYPSYFNQMAKGRRVDGKLALIDLAHKLERYYTERGTYAGATLGGVGGLYPTVSPGGFYALAIGSQTTDGFVILATPRGKQVGDACNTLGYNQWGDRSVGTGTTMTVDQCW